MPSARESGSVPAATPALVTVHVWGVPNRQVPAALARMATDRLRLKYVPGLRFARLLGTGRGDTFTVRDANSNRWALLATWGSEAEAAPEGAARERAGGRAGVCAVGHVRRSFRRR